MADSSIIFLIISLLLFLFSIGLVFYILHLRRKLEDLSFRKSSQSVKYGRLTEQWIPFSAQFPHDPARFRFLGEPIDGLVFGDNGIVFTEFKTATSRLNPRQQRIKELVQDKKVEWLEFRVH